MPRRKVDQPIANGDDLLALPPPRVVTKGHGHAHERDPYETPPGAIPAKVSDVQTTAQGPIKRTQSKADELARQQAKADARERGRRYAQYLDQLSLNGGNQIDALALVYGLSIEEVSAQREELLADVRSGIGNTDLAEVLERNDLGINNRALILRKWMYSDNPAASLKAADMIQELEGTGASQGSFEAFLRLHKTQRRA